MSFDYIRYEIEESHHDGEVIGRWYRRDGMDRVTQYRRSFKDSTPIGMVFDVLKENLDAIT